MEVAENTTTSCQSNLSNEKLSSVNMENQESFQKVICKFFNEGRCRFGDKCMNIHSESLINISPVANDNSKKKFKLKSKNKKIQNFETEVSQKKRSMKTASDVIHRIQWDNQVNSEHVKIGYLDRFIGIVEEPFFKFTNWGNIEMAELDALAIPQHRIQYFKYRDSIIWDKKEKIDHVFCSIGCDNFKDFIEFIKEIDAKKDFDNQIRLETHEYNDLEDDESSEYDSDDEIELTINIGATSCVPTQIMHINDQTRSTHFLAIQITNPYIVENAIKLQKHITNQEEVLNECCMKSSLFHITIGMLRLENIDAVIEARNLIDNLKEPLERLAKNIDLNIKGLDTFGQRVLYAKVSPQPEDEFWMMISEIKNQISNTTKNIIVTDKFEFTPHMTILKVNRPTTKIRRSKYLPSALYEEHINMEFGVQKFNNIQLCVIELSTRFDGFYSTVNHISI